MTYGKNFRVNRLMLAFALGVVFVTLLVLGLVRVELGVADHSAGEGRRTKFDRPIGEGLVVTRAGYYGVRFVECDAIKIAKRKLGVLTIGALNVLQIKNLKVVLPENLRRGDCAPGNTSRPERAVSQELVRIFGIDKSILDGRFPGTKFSGVEIDGLQVFELDAATNVVFRFSAQDGKLGRRGLELEGCLVNDGGTTQNVGKAVLEVKPELRLRWPDGEMTFNQTGEMK